MNENEPVNENTTDSPEKRVADYVEDLCRHIAANGYDMLADVAVESLATDDTVPVDAYLHSVKTAWCLHRAAVHYARQYGVERGAADRARADAQFEHSHRVQAERKAEKLEADLAQSGLLVESQRLRMEEMEQQQREVRQQMLETAEAALLEQQQRNQDLETRCSQQLMKIAELTTHSSQQLDNIFELQEQVHKLEQQEQKKQEPAIPATGGLLRDVSHYTEMAETDTPDADVSAEQQIRTLHEIIDAQAETIARLHSEVSVLNTKVSGFERMQKDDRMADSGTLDAGTAEPEPEPQPVQVREGRWRTRAGQVRNVVAYPQDDENYTTYYPWWDGKETTWANDGRWTDRPSSMDLVEYLGPIESEPGSEQIAS